MLCELQRFGSVWNAFECLVNVAPRATNAVSTGGTVAAASALLAGCESVPSHFSCAVTAARRLAESADMTELSRELSAERPLVVIALRTASRLRNRLAHGALDLPDPGHWGGTSARHHYLALLATRLVLFPVQMLAAQRFDGETGADFHTGASLGGCST